MSSCLNLFWRIFYHSLYYFLLLILLLLLCVTPTDAIRQSYINSQRFHILIIIICLSVTLATVLCIYFFRLYVTRTVLASIPKPYVPIEKGDVRRSVRKMILAGLRRSAAIAYECRPRVVTARSVSGSASDGTKNAEEQMKKDRGDRRTTAGQKKFLRGFVGLNTAATAEDKMGTSLPPHKTAWGEIEQLGWASPNCPDLPNLQYSTVISELPHLIEAKALTLAPPAPDGQLHILDPDTIELLQRPDHFVLRQYIARLSDLGVLPASPTTEDFLSVYDHARYSTRPISNARFRELMHLFAEILRAMQPLDPAILEDDLDQDNHGATVSTSSESDIDDHAPRASPSTSRSRASSSHLNRQLSNATTSSSKTNWSQRPRKRAVTVRATRTLTGTFRTAPTSPKAGNQSPSPTSSANSFAQTRAAFVPSDGGSSLQLE